MDENDQKLQAKVAENLTKSLSTGYSLNEKGFLLYKNRLYIPNVPKIKLLILNEIVGLWADPGFIPFIFAPTKDPQCWLFRQQPANKLQSHPK